MIATLRKDRQRPAAPRTHGSMVLEPSLTHHGLLACEASTGLTNLQCMHTAYDYLPLSSHSPFFFPENLCETWIVGEKRGLDHIHPCNPDQRSHRSTGAHSYYYKHLDGHICFASPTTLSRCVPDRVRRYSRDQMGCLNSCLAMNTTERAGLTTRRFLLST